MSPRTSDFPIPPEAAGPANEANLESGPHHKPPSTPTSLSQQTGVQIRQHLIDSLQADLIGPFAPEGTTSEPEVLSQKPTRWYLTGFLTPETARERLADPDPTAEEEAASGDDKATQDANESDAAPKIKNRWPASMGMSVLLPAAPNATTNSKTPDTLQVTLTFGEYTPIDYPVDPNDDPANPQGKTRPAWKRVACGPLAIALPLDPKSIAAGVRVPGTEGLQLVGRLIDAPGTYLPTGARALSLFLVNRRVVPDARKPDEQCIFQVQMGFGYAPGFLARTNDQGELSDDWDEQVSDVQFRKRCEYGVGHGVAVAVVPAEAGKVVTALHTTWLPTATVKSVTTRSHDRVETGMEALAAFNTAAEIRKELLPLPEAYAAWIADQRIAGGKLERQNRQDTAQALMDGAETACERIAAGIELLATDSEVRRAFQLANSAMATAALQRDSGPEGSNLYNSEKRPQWRLFQLAFLLLNLRSVADPKDDYRDTVELIFFPTGGGKTEAYLVVIAYTLALRRLRGQQRADGGLGVAVLLRYTLRLLTLDQLSRAASLICALEQLRKQHTHELGTSRFSIGLWVGRSATPNTMKDVSEQIGRYKNDNSKSAVSPFPLSHCPWCGSASLKPGKKAFDLKRYPSATKCERVVVACTNWKCEFSEAKNPDGLPVVFVDEQIYRELPSFVIATVDKFAMMPWRGEIGMFFGRATERDERQFYGPMNKAPKGALKLPDGLRPPELIVQDELHLISGPLGTMVGLYETAIDELCSYGPAGERIRPKVLAATATVRRSQYQVRALFGRERELFPPPGIDDSETFFAQVDDKNPGRLYLGVAASGRAMKAILLRAYISLLGAGFARFDATGDPDQPADGYLTLAGYFNSLRELGGMRRLVEDDVRSRVAGAEFRKPLNWQGPHPWVRNRSKWYEPVELTSREPTETIKESKARISHPHASADKPVDVLLASNMISVGIDIDRLGLMVVAGQPKTTSEYIQASSRVGRNTKYPGLVVTCFNTMRPRDRSHYERFENYHESFYRHVEATSVTPFSGPTLDRGLAGALVAMVRLGDEELTKPLAAMDIAQRRDTRNAVVEALKRRALHSGADDAETLSEHVAQRARKLLDHWEQVMENAVEGAGKRTYSAYDRVTPKAGAPFLHTALDDAEFTTVAGKQDPESHFVAPTSLRDVEPTVPLWLPSTQGGK